MSYTGYKTVAFGSSKADLATVGYALYDGNGVLVVARTTDGVQDLGGGQYGATVTFPSGFDGRITWDTGEVTPVYASEAINDADDEADVQTLEELAIVRENVEQLVGTYETDIETDGASPGAAFTEINRAEVPKVEGCPLLLRLRAFVVDQTTLPTLRHIARHQGTGAPVNLSSVLSASSESSSGSESEADDGSLAVRICEWFHGGKVDSVRGWEVDGIAVAPAQGVIGVALPDGSTDEAGLYRIEWGLKNASGRLLTSWRSFMMVQPSAFADSDVRKGPFTLEELRMALRDSERTENFLLDDVEFSDSQVAWAIARPVEFWNTETPQIRKFTTRTFPFREQWLRATIGFLCEIAAQGYRRDTGLVDNAGGVSVKDKDKEVPYAREAERRIAEYRMFMLHKKNEVNMSRMYRVYVSPEYYRRGGAW